MKKVPNLVVVLFMTAFTENYYGSAQNLQKSLLVEWTSFQYNGLLFTLFPIQIDPFISETTNAQRDYVKFLLYNSGSAGIPTTQRFIPLDPTKLSAGITGFDPSLPTMIYIHGYTETEDGDAVKEVLSAVNQSKRWNLVFVNWNVLSAGPWYLVALYNVRATGRLLAKFIDSLASAMQDPALFLQNLHVVGFSLGSHVAGIAGQQVTVGRIGRITGLDPAFVYVDYSNNAKGLRLDEGDAEFVDIIHTSGGYYGTPFVSGHIDFFPNGGTPIQPGCGILFGTLCSHFRSCLFFAESVRNPDSFKSLQCDSWEKYKSGGCSNNARVNMGVSVPKTARGTYYLSTSSAPPFSLPA